ncbi:hypothetical protein [Bradyrhizobium genosp. A]|uniref:hypothetical protein n=1 Tax=Bradyrhizobium genosp. A TaxID=83626 RepID=UPI003CFAD92D
MRHIALRALVIGLFIPLLASAPAHAQATRTWVSGVGDDANPCSRTAPCKTFAGAISRTAAAGEINCLDPGGFGAVTVIKSMTIACQMGTAGVLVSGTNGIIFSGGANDYLYLKGLDIEGLGTGLSGILFNSGALLHVEDCIIRDFLTAGITIQPAASAKFVVTRTTLFNNGNGSTGTGLMVKPSAGGTSGAIDHVIADRNTTGIQADGSGGGVVNISVSDSVISGNALVGANATTSSTAAGMMLRRVAVTGNGTGLQNASASSFMRVGDSLITANGTGVNGTVSSYGTNQLDQNGADGTLTAIPAPALK